MSERLAAMRSIFYPKSIAFVGASNSPNKWGFIILHNLIMGGFEGPIYPVNPSQSKIIGLKAYKKITDIPDAVDLAIFTIPAKTMPDAISEAAKKGVRAGVVISAGFSELGIEGLELQQEMVSRARKAGMVLVGPNGQGIVTPESKLYPWMPSFLPPAGKVAVISQSGNVMTMLTQGLVQYGFGISKGVSVGNSADLQFEDYFRYLKDDPETKVILAYIEGVEGGRDFFKTAAETTREKPIVVLKAGRTRAGTQAARSHTGVLAGQEAVFDAACRQAGIILAESMEQASMIAAGLVNCPLPGGRRIGMVTGGGGVGVLAADASERAGLDVVGFSDELIDKLRAILPPWWSPGNPVDMVAGLGYAGPLEITRALFDSSEVDGVIILGIGWVYGMADSFKQSPFAKKIDPEAFLKGHYDRELAYCRELAKIANQQRKPLYLLSWVADRAIRSGFQGLAELLEQEVMVYPTIEYAVDAFAAMAHYSEYRRSFES